MEEVRYIYFIYTFFIYLYIIYSKSDVDFIIVISDCLFQLLADSETAQIGAVVLGCQLLMAVGVTVWVVRKARQELDKSLKARAAKDLGQLERQAANIVLSNSQSSSSGKDVVLTVVGR